MLKPLERVLVVPRSGSAPLTGHFMSYNHFGNLMVAYHEETSNGDEWGVWSREEVVGSAEPCQCDSARRARAEITHTGSAPGHLQ